ncbi:hypothetical protein F0562_006795 [Nyssa sinensis]|uniref:Uncharacterized protein n=1 Tax=Nyssa sinensis TaxID=561372 RepID=A0A5J5AM48_9ASTE|nr:hypothetical protein F0562_006795 [Nyssa sinensis]
MRRLITSLQGLTPPNMLRGSPFLLLFTPASVRSASLRRKTISNNLGKDTGPLHQTGKNVLSADGLKLYPIQGCTYEIRIYLDIILVSG